MVCLVFHVVFHFLREDSKKDHFRKKLFNSKVNSGTSHMTCLPRMETSEASVKETCLFHSRDGNTMIAAILLFTISTNV